TSPAAYYSTLFHEFVHATGHESRLNRAALKDVRFGSEVYAEEELVAEVAACYLTTTCGLDTTLAASASYLAGWIKKLKADSRMVFRVASASREAAQFILGERPEEKVEEA